MDAPRELKQRRARCVDHGRFRGGDEFWISCERVFVAEILDDRRLGADVARRETGCIEFIQFRCMNANCVGVDRRTFQVAGQRHDHARVDAAGKISAHWNIRAQPLLDRLQQKLLEVVNEPLRIVAAFLRTFIGKIHFPKRALFH